MTDENRPRNNMKKFITIWIGCSLALAVGALAQQEDAEPTPTKKQRQKAKSAQAAQPSAGQPAQQAPHAGKQAKGHAAAPKKPHAQAPAPGPTDTDANSNDAMKAEQKKRVTRGNQPPVNRQILPRRPRQRMPGQNRSPRPLPPLRPPNRPASPSRKGKGKAKQVDVQKIKTQNANFRAQPKPQQVPAVTFNASRQISGSEHWQGTQYTVFRSYRPQWHDQTWYRSRYNRIELIAGGYYFFDAGYWYPAWGYQPTAQYYVYDGPIYAGSRAEPPDRVIADVQAALQEMGYYRGEVDGLLGPLTREALIGYQTDNGLYITAAIDQPTLDSLGI